jgi:CRISPR-associated exonuclease Cas4
MDESLPLSALQHLLFCERQCALIHVEQVWEENRFTAEGRVLHERVDAGGAESRPGLRVVRSLHLRSLRLGLHGVADVVEFHAFTKEEALLGIPPDSASGVPREIAGKTAPGQPFPVEYKRGKPKEHRADEVQLCAQALCLEEMFALPVPAGALFYGQNRRRTEIAFDETLRALTLATAERLHALIASGRTPSARREKKCEACSLVELCLPDALKFQRGANAWNDRAFTDSLTETPAV